MDTDLIRHFVLHADGTTDVCSSLARIMNGPEPVHAQKEDFALGANCIVNGLLLEEVRRYGRERGMSPEVQAWLRESASYVDTQAWAELPIQGTDGHAYLVRLNYYNTRGAMPQPVGGRAVLYTNTLFASSAGLGALVFGKPVYGHVSVLCCRVLSHGAYAPADDTYQEGQHPGWEAVDYTTLVAVLPVRDWGAVGEWAEALGRGVHSDGCYAILRECVVQRLAYVRQRVTQIRALLDTLTADDQDKRKRARLEADLAYLQPICTDLEGCEIPDPA